MQTNNHHPFLDQPRFADMSQGIEEIERWLHDLLRQGLAVLPDQPRDYWDFISKRMVDLKLPSLARRINHLQSIILKTTSEPPFQKILPELSEIGLLINSFQRIKSLPAPMQREILLQLGWNVRKEELESIKPITDHWLVVGSATGQEEKLNFRKTWLWPFQTSRPAMLLEFAWKGQSFSDQPDTGSIIHAEMTFYPGSFSFRAQTGKLFDTQIDTFKSRFGDGNINTFFKRYSQVGTRNPWIIDFPVVLNEVIPVYCKGEYYLIDNEKNSIPVSNSVQEAMRLLILSANNPSSVFGEWNGEIFIPLTFIRPNTLLPLHWPL